MYNLPISGILAMTECFTIIFGISLHIVQGGKILITCFICCQFGLQITLINKTGIYLLHGLQLLDHDIFDAYV